MNGILFAVCYLMVLPFFWTFRAKFEREAYTQSMLVQFELGGSLTEPEMSANAEKMVQTFCGPAYAWMSTVRKTYAWAMQTQRAINLGAITNDTDCVSDVEAMKFG